jgi:hypothetical protein
MHLTRSGVLEARLARSAGQSGRRARDRRCGGGAGGSAPLASRAPAIDGLGWPMSAMTT